MGEVELPHFSLGAPPDVTLSGVPKIRVGDRVELTRGVEPCDKLVRETLVVDEAVCAGRADGLFVKLLGIESAAFDAGDLGTDQRCTALEVRGAVLGPLAELTMM